MNHNTPDMSTIEMWSIVPLDPVRIGLCLPLRGKRLFPEPVGDGGPIKLGVLTPNGRSGPRVSRM